MNELQDLDLDKEPEPGPRPPSPRPRTPWVLAAVVLAALAGALYWYGRGPAAPVAPAASPAAASPPGPSARAPLGGAAAPVDLPPLDQSDAVVRDLVGGLSSHPAVMAWLTTSGLIRNFVVVVDNIASGMTPSRHLRALAPRGRFPVLGSSGQVVIDPAGYARYDGIAAAVSGIDAAGAARVYSMLKPRIEEAYRDLGHDGSFDVPLEAAIVTLLQAPAVDGEAALLPRGALYRFSDDRLERLTPAQKQLVRMGPLHVRAIQRTLQQIAAALGIPADRLPAR